MVLLAAVMAFSLAVAGVAAVLEPAPAQVPRAEASKATPVRVIGTPFVPNTNPRER